MFQMADITRTTREPYQYQGLVNALTGMADRQERDRLQREAEELEAETAERWGRIAEGLAASGGDINKIDPVDLSWGMATDPSKFESIRGVVSPPAPYEQARARYLDAQADRWIREADAMQPQAPGIDYSQFDPGFLEAMGVDPFSLPQTGQEQPSSQGLREGATPLETANWLAERGFNIPAGLIMQIVSGPEGAEGEAGITPELAQNMAMLEYMAETNQKFGEFGAESLGGEDEFIYQMIQKDITPNSPEWDALLMMYREARERENRQEPPPPTGGEGRRGGFFDRFRRSAAPQVVPGQTPDIHETERFGETFPPQGRPQSLEHQVERTREARGEAPLAPREPAISPAQAEQIRERVRQAESQGIPREQIIEMLKEYVANPEAFFE